MTRRRGKSAAQTAANPTFLVHRVTVLSLPPSYSRAHKRFSPTGLNLNKRVGKDGGNLYGRYPR